MRTMCKYVQKMKPHDYDERGQIANSMFKKLGANADFLRRIVFSDAETFHISSYGYVNQYNAQIWSSEKPQTARKQIRESPKMNGAVCITP